MAILTLTCVCGKDFQRTDVYLKYQEQQPNVLWKWKLTYCDECFKQKREQALRRLPDVLDSLSS
jgi:hypothetical protein